MADSESKIRNKKENKATNNWNIPNALSVLRIALTPVIVLLLLDDDRLKNLLAALALGAAALTDFLDGYLARKHGKETRLGQFLDPLADKIYILATFIVLSVNGRLPWWVTGVIVGREVVITIFRIYAGTRGASVPASIWGKLKTNSQLIALVLLILHFNATFYVYIEIAAVAAAVTLTLYSGLDYILKAGKYLAVSEGG